MTDRSAPLPAPGAPLPAPGDRLPAPGDALPAPGDALPAPAAALPAPGSRPDLLIGLTGPIGCGKSTVAAMLGELGCEVIDADVLARQVTEPGSPALAEIRQRFGGDVFAPDGSLDRAAIARVVFADPNALADLERITHPRVREQINQRLAAAAGEGTPVAVIEAIKLVESGLADHCDEVWLVECSAEAQHQRLQGRGAAADDVKARIKAQGTDLVGRLSAALDGRVRYRRLSTDGTLAETRERVEDALADALSR